MRDTEYATEVAPPGRHTWPSTPNEEARLERLHIKALGVVEVRFSWWKDGKLMARPLDLDEDDLIALMTDAVRTGALSATFVPRLLAAVGAAPPKLVPHKGTARATEPPH